MKFSLRKSGLLLFVLLIAASLALAACGGGDKKDEGGKAADLKQSYDGAAGVSVKYPEGWAVVDSPDGSVILASNQAMLDIITAATDDPPTIAKGQAGLMILVMPADQALGGMTLKELVGMMASGGAFEAGEVKDVKIGDKDANRSDIVADGMDGFTVGLEKDGAVVIGMGIAAKGEMKDREATLLAIIESAAYKAPAG